MQSTQNNDEIVKIQDRQWGEIGHGPHSGILTPLWFRAVTSSTMTLAVAANCVNVPSGFSNSAPPPVNNTPFILLTRALTSAAGDVYCSHSHA